MNKRAHRKGFFILVCIGLMYMSIAFNFTDRFSMKRTATVHTSATPASLAVAIPERSTDTAHAGQNLSAKSPTVEPSFFIAIPIVSSAIKDGLIEKEGLVCIKRETNTGIDFKKPLDILKDKDEDGLKSIAEIIGKKQLLHLLKKDGISIKDDLDLGDIILGKSYTVEKNVLLTLFDNHVTDDFNDLFPFTCGDFEMAKSAKGFIMSAAHGQTKNDHQTVDMEWMMPNLANLPMKAALEKLAAKTSKVRIYGSGFVTDQNPKAYEKVKGEAECEIYGRSGRQ